MFSIIIPTYKRLEQLKSCVKSLNKQSFSGEYEVIIVNDLPEDLILMDMFEGEYKFDIFLINNEKNIGASGCRNVGVKHARFDWVMFLDDDDFFHEDKLLVIFQQISKDESLDYIINAADINLVDEKIVYSTIPKPNRETIFSLNNMGGAPLLSVKREVFLSLGGYDTSLSALEDYELNIRLLSAELRFAVLCEKLTICNYSSNIGSVSKSVENNINSLQAIHKKYKFEISPSDIKNSFSWIYGSLAYKSILLHDGACRRLYLKSFNYKPSLKSLLLVIVCFFNQRLLLKLRGFF